MHVHFLMDHCNSKQWFCFRHSPGVSKVLKSTGIKLTFFIQANSSITALPFVEKYFAVVVLHIYLPVTGLRQMLTIGRFAQFPLD